MSIKYKGQTICGGTGIPPGGTTGQVLTKKSDDDYDTYWGDVEGGSVAPPEPEGTFEWWSPHMTSDNAPAPYVVSASPNYKTYYPYCGFDNNRDTMFHSQDIANSWIQFDFGNRTTIKGIRFYPYSSQSGIWYTSIPKRFVLEASIDGNSWDEIYQEDGNKYETAERDVWHEFEFDSSVCYRYYKVTCIETYQGNNYFATGEIEFYKLVTTAQLIAQQQQIRADIDFISVMTGVDLT